MSSQSIRLSLLLLLFLLPLALPPTQGYFGPSPTPQTVGTSTLTPYWNTYFQKNLKWTLYWLNASTFQVSNDLNITQTKITDGSKWTLNFTATQAGTYELNATLSNIASFTATATRLNLTSTDGNKFYYDWSDVPLNTGLCSGAFLSGFSATVQNDVMTFFARVTGIMVGCFVKIDPSTVGTSTSGVAIGLDSKVCFQSTLWWVVYSDGTNWVYASSPDGKTWTLGTSSIDPSGANGGITMTMVCDGTYIYLTYPKGGAPCVSTGLCFRRGQTSNTGIITWSGNQLVTSSNVRPDNTLYGLAVGSDGSYWLTSQDSNKNPQIDKSSTQGGVWTEASGFPKVLTSSNPSISSSIILPLTNGKMIALYDTGGAGTVIKDQIWDGSAWGATETATSTGLNTAATYSALTLGDNVYLLFATSSDVRMVTRISGAWSGETIVASVVATSPQLTLDTIANPNTLYAFYDNGAVITYKTSSDGGTTWSSTTAWFTASNLQTYDSVSTVTTNPSGGTDTFLGYLYEEGTSSPFNIRFNFIDLTTPSSQAPNLVTVRNPLPNLTIIPPNLNLTLPNIPIQPYAFAAYTMIFTGIVGLGVIEVPGLRQRLRKGEYGVVESVGLKQSRREKQRHYDAKPQKEHLPKGKAVKVKTKQTRKDKWKPKRRPRW